MSSDLRLKKLRGSGGYIMARVTDQQQSLGNLGGPDLFLAPIGRIDPEYITKYFCNVCEKESESAPKIDYESPNEQVAENLVLAERGKYLCNTCNSSIAEYRKFQKTDENQDVGMAKPLEKQPDVPPATNPDTTFRPEKTSQQIAPSAEHATKTQPDEQINSIAGMIIYDGSAKKIGTAKQVGVDSSQTVVLVIAKNDGTEYLIPWNNVKTVGEVILLHGDQSQTAESDKCADCGFSNKIDAKFCEECGTSLT